MEWTLQVVSILQITSCELAVSKLNVEVAKFSIKCHEVYYPSSKNLQLLVNGSIITKLSLEVYMAAWKIFIGKKYKN